MVFKKIITLAFVFNLISSSLQSSFTQDDIFSFPRYKVILTREKVSKNDIGNSDIVMTSSLGQPFSCNIPSVTIEEERLAREKKETEQDSEQDKQHAIEKGLDLLEPLGKKCMQFITGTNQYWTYEYCHNRYVKQFHMERSKDGKNENEVVSFYLGLYPGLTQSDLQSLDNNKALSKSNPNVPTILKNEGDGVYLAQTWEHGSICDLTEKPRTIEIQYRCDMQGSDRVSSFVEVSTCNYQLIIFTPRLCEDMGLSKSHYIEPHQIKCRPIVSEAKLIEQEETKQEDIKPKLPTEEVKEAEVDDKETLLNMFSELRNQLSQLKFQANNYDSQDKQATFFSIDEQGNLVNNPDFSRLFAADFTTTTNNNNNNNNNLDVKPKKKQQAKEQHENNQAYNQKYD